MKFAHKANLISKKHFPEDITPDTIEDFTDQLSSFYCDFINLFVEDILAGGYLEIGFADGIIQSLGKYQRLLGNLTFPDPAMDIISSCNNLLFQKHLTYYEYSWSIKKSDDNKRIMIANVLKDIGYEGLITDKDIFLRSELIQNYDKFFSLTLKVSFNDHKLSADPSKLAELLSIKKEIEFLEPFWPKSDDKGKAGISLRTKFLFSLLLDKVNYLVGLIYKQHRADGDSYIIQDGFRETRLESNPNFLNNKVKIAFHRVGLVDGHEEVDVTELNSGSHNLEQKFLSGDALALSELRALVRLIVSDKDVSFSHEDLLSYLDEIDRKGFSNYDNEVVNQFHLYLLNNQLAYNIKHRSSEMSISNLMGEIKKLSRKYGIHNYFPYLKLCRKYLWEFNHTFAEPQKDTECITRLRQILQKFNNCLKDLDRTFVWAKHNAFTPFLETKQSCTIKIDYRRNTYHLFIASAYSIPLNYDSILATITGLKSLPEILKQQIQNAEGLIANRKDILQTKDEVKELKNDIESYEKRQIEILGIFAAIVLFVSGNIQIFTKVESLSQGLHFMFIFALSLSLFVSMIWIIFKDRSQQIHMKQWVIIVIYFLTLLYAVFTITFDMKSFKELIALLRLYLP